MKSLAEQRQFFDSVRDNIDRELRFTGLEDFLVERDIDVSIGRIVVGRSFDYSSRLASMDIDLDPLATRLATIHEVGISVEDEKRRSYKGLKVGEALHREPVQPAAHGLELDCIQFVSIEAAIHRLLMEKHGNLRFLTKSLLKIDPAGD